MEDSPLARRLWRGRWTLRVYIGLVLVVALGFIVAYVATIGTDKLPQQIVRFALTCALMLALWRGSPVARWVCVVLFGLGGAAAMLLVAGPKAPTGMAWALAGVQAAYLPMAVLLALPTPVSDFLRYQRAVRRGAGVA